MGVVKPPSPARGEVWLTKLDPTVGNEIQKTRPCLVVSPDTMNGSLGTVIVMPMTSGSHDEPFRIPSSFGRVGGLLLGDQIRSASKRRFIKLLGHIDEPTMLAALAMLREMFEE